MNLDRAATCIERSLEEDLCRARVFGFEQFKARMSLRSSCRAVESVPVTVFPNLLSRKHIQSTGRRQTWRSRGHQLHVEHRISSVLCRSEVGSFRNLRGTNWLVVWAEQDAGQEFQEAPEASPPPHHQSKESLQIYLVLSELDGCPGHDVGTYMYTRWGSRCLI